MQNTERGFRAGPGKEFALLPADVSTETGYEFGWSQIEGITALILSFLGEQPDPVNRKSSFGLVGRRSKEKIQKQNLKVLEVLKDNL